MADIDRTESRGDVDRTMALESESPAIVSDVVAPDLIHERFNSTREANLVASGLQEEWPKYLEANHLLSILRASILFAPRFGLIEERVIGNKGLLDNLHSPDRPTDVEKPRVHVKAARIDNLDCAIELEMDVDSASVGDSKILEIARTISINSDLKISVHSVLRGLLDELKSDPYQSLRSTVFHCKLENTTVLELSYSEPQEHSKARLKCRFRSLDPQNRNTFMEVFDRVSGRKLAQKDFDPEVIALAKLTDADIATSADIAEKLRNAENLFNANELDERPLSDQKGKTPYLVEKFTCTPSVDSKISEVVSDLYRDIQRTQRNSYAEGVAVILPGLAYQISAPSREPFSILKSCATGLLSVVNSTFTNSIRRSVEDSILNARRIELAVQFPGLDESILYSVVENLAIMNPNLNIDMSGHVDYDQFWELKKDPSLLFRNAGKVKLVDPDGYKIEIQVHQIKDSFAAMADSYFPRNEADDGSHRQIYTDEHIGSMNNLLRTENVYRQVKHRYIDLEDQGEALIVAPMSADMNRFSAVANVRIVSDDLILKERPVNDRVALRKINALFSQINEAIKESQPSL